MKKFSDLTVLLLICSLFLGFFTTVYFFRNSDGASNNKASQLKVIPDQGRQNPKNRAETDRETVKADKPRHRLPGKVVTGIDALLATGLSIGLSLIFQGRLKLIHLCLVVGVFVTVIDLFLRFGLKFG